MARPCTNIPASLFWSIHNTDNADNDPILEGIGPAYVIETTSIEHPRTAKVYEPVSEQIPTPNIFNFVSKPMLEGMEPGHKAHSASGNTYQA